MDLYETTEDSTFCCKFCEYINEHRDVFLNKVLVRRIHKCKILIFQQKHNILRCMKEWEKRKLKHIINIGQKYDIEFRNRRKEIDNKHYQKMKSKQQTEHNGHWFFVRKDLT